MIDARPSKQMTGMYQTRVCKTCLRYQMCVEDLNASICFYCKVHNSIAGCRNVSAHVFSIAVELVCEMFRVK